MHKFKKFWFQVVIKPYLLSSFTSGGLKPKLLHAYTQRVEH